MPSKQTPSNSKYAANPGNPQRFAKTVHVRIPRLVILCGTMGTGKTTLARVLGATIGYQRFAFADQVRLEITDRICSQSGVPDGMPELACQGWESVKDDPFILYRKPTPGPIRALLQWYGTEYRRNEDPFYWVNKAIGTIDALLHAGPVVIDDYRFPEEGHIGRMLNIKPLRILLRPENSILVGQDNRFTAHESEQNIAKLTVEMSCDYKHTLECQAAVLKTILTSPVPCSRMTVKLPQSFLA